MKAITGSIIVVALVGMIGCGDKRAFRPIKIDECNLTASQIIDGMGASSILATKQVQGDDSAILGTDLYWKMAPPSKKGEAATPEAVVIDLLLEFGDGGAIVKFSGDAKKATDKSSISLKAIAGKHLKTDIDLSDQELSDVNGAMRLSAMTIEDCSNTFVLAVERAGVSVYTYTQQVAGSIVSYKMTSSSVKGAMSVTQAMTKVVETETSSQQQGAINQTGVTSGTTTPPIKSTVVSDPSSEVIPAVEQQASSEEALKKDEEGQ